jgi:hypothetical protein
VDNFRSTVENRQDFGRQNSNNSKVAAMGPILQKPQEIKEFRRSSRNGLGQFTPPFNLILKQ